MSCVLPDPPNCIIATLQYSSNFFLSSASSFSRPRKVRCYSWSLTDNQYLLRTRNTFQLLYLGVVLRKSVALMSDIYRVPISIVFPAQKRLLNASAAERCTYARISSAAEPANAAASPAEPEYPYAAVSPTGPTSRCRGTGSKRKCATRERELNLTEHDQDGRIRLKQVWMKDG